jgi:myo-inositol-1(or 4)-monophosphatase
MAKRQAKNQTALELEKRIRFNRSSLSRRELQEMLTFTKGLARASGALALTYYGRTNPSLRFDHDLITEADLAVQEYIHKEVLAVYPKHKFLGEEGRAIPRDVDLEDPLWVVDPVDGSASFCAGMPIWGVSIALFDGGKPVLGVVYLPVVNELYSALAGAPAMLNDREICSRDEIIDNESLLLTYSRFHTDFKSDFSGKIRALGSTAAHIAYVARGAACGAILGRVHVWDVAAGMIILEAAGGTLRELSGKRVDLSRYLDGSRVDTILVAAGKGLHHDIAGMIGPR